MIRFGIISETDPSKGLARVAFEEDDLTTDWLPFVVAKAQRDSYFYCPDVGEHVACLMDQNAENGVILGAIYDAKSAPKASSEDLASVVFDDGSKVVFDRSNGKLEIDTQGEIVIKSASNVSIECQTATIKANSVEIDAANSAVKGNLSVDGTLAASGEISSNVDVRAGVISLVQHKHPTAPTGPVSPPIP